MAFALITVGLMMVISAVRDTQDTFVCLVKSDFTGPKSFVYWIIALMIIGAIGNVEKLKPFSDAFLVLIILALFLAKGDPNKATGGFFEKFMQALGSIGSTSATSTATSVGNKLLGNIGA